MIREKNYSLIKAIRESSCCSKSDGGGGETTFDDVVKYYTGFSPDEIEDWKILQNADESIVWASSPFVKVSDSESDTFYDFIESENSNWIINSMMFTDGVLAPNFGDRTAAYIVASVQYNKPSPI